MKLRVEGIKNFSESNLLSQRIFFFPRGGAVPLMKFISHLFLLPTRVKDVLEVRKTLNLFYFKEADWSLSRFHICSYWPEVFWLGKIFLLLSPFSKCPTKTCVRMGNIFWVPKESSIAWKRQWNCVLWGGPSRTKMSQNNLFKHSMHIFFIHTNICRTTDKMWFWTAFTISFHIHIKRCPPPPLSLLRQLLHGAWHIYYLKSWFQVYFWNQRNSRGHYIRESSTFIPLSGNK